MKKKSYEKTLTIEQFNDLMSDLDFIDDLDIKVQRTEVILDFNKCKYYVSLTGNIDETANVGNIWRQFTKMVSPNLFELPEGLFGKVTTKLDNHKTRVSWEIKDPGNYSYTLDAKSKKWLKCYSYDVNSSFSYAMTKPMPNTKVEPRMYDIVGQNEIGFLKNGYVTITEGDYAEYIFPLIESPFKEYVEKYYNKKQLAKTKDERDKWKYFLNIPTGMMHKRNIFIRDAILFYAAEHIRQYIDDDTVYCNTDSIISTKRRTDIPLGNNLGEFKEEHINDDFKYIQAGIYQWGDECHYTGIPKGIITDIEKADDWINNLPYKYDEKTRRIIANGKS